MKKWFILLLITLLPVSSSQNLKGNHITDINGVLKYLRGSVNLYGVKIGNTELQRNILNLAQQKIIKVHVLTSKKNINNMQPLKRLGAKIYGIDANFSNSLIIVKSSAIIIPTSNGKYEILTEPNRIAQIESILSTYWQFAKQY